MWTTLDYQIVRIDMYTYALVFAAGFAAFFFGEFVFFAMLEDLVINYLFYFGIFVAI